MNNRVAELSSELDEIQKQRQALEQTVDDATREDSKHSLYFGQILMSVENLFLRCTAKRKSIQHFLELKEDEAAKGGKDEGSQDEGEDSFRRKKTTAIRQLNVIQNYVKDFREITQTLRRERAQNQPQQRQAQVDEGERVLAIEFKTAEPARGDRGSQGSGSHSNTKDLSRG